MQNTQKLADLHMAVYINALLYRQGKITHEMFICANRIFTQRLLDFEKYLVDTLNKTA